MLKAIGKLLYMVGKALGGDSVEKIKPCGTVDINIASSILLDKLEEMGCEAEIYLPDIEIKVYRKEDVESCYEMEEVSAIKYVAEVHDCYFDTDIAWSLGLFFADGSCGLRGNKFGGAWWRITNTDRSLLERAIIGLEKQWPNLKFEIVSYPSEAKGQLTNYGERRLGLNHLEIRPISRHNDGLRGKFIKEFREIFYSDKEKKMPPEMWGSPLRCKRAFLEGVIAGDGTKNRSCITIKGKMGLAGLIDCMLDCRWTFTIRDEKRIEDCRYIYYNRRREGIGKILEFLDGKDFVSVKEIVEKVGINRTSCRNFLDKLQEDKFIIERRLWSQRREVKLISPYTACDDFAAELYGKFAGLVWTNVHALSCFISDENIFYFIEPQTGKISQTLEGWQGNDIRFVLMR